MVTYHQSENIKAFKGFLKNVYLFFSYNISWQQFFLSLLLPVLPHPKDILGDSLMQSKLVLNLLCSQDVFELWIFLPQPPMCWDYMCVSLCCVFLMTVFYKHIIILTYTLHIYTPSLLACHSIVPFLVCNMFFYIFKTSTCERRDAIIVFLIWKIARCGHLN